MLANVALIALALFEHRIQKMNETPIREVCLDDKVVENVSGSSATLGIRCTRGVLS